MKPRWYEIRAEAGTGEAEIRIYSRIGSNWLFGGIEPEQFAADLAALGPLARLNVRINSKGGNVFDGAAIYNILQRQDAEVVTYVDGAALSIASLIALAGSRVVMAEASWLMIHDPYGSTLDGTAADHRKTAEALDALAGVVAGIYEGRSTMSADQAVEAMHAETWYTPQQAVDIGFVDEIAGVAVPDALAGLDFAAAGFRNVPPQLLHREDPPASSAEAEPTTQADPPVETDGSAAGDTPATVDPRVIDLLTKRRHGAPKEA